MLLVDLLQIINENTSVNIWLCGEVVSIYDGKDAIDTKYNNYPVISCGVVNKAKTGESTSDCMYIEIIEP